MIWAQLLEAWLALTSVKYRDNVLVLILLNQWLKLTMLWATQPSEVTEIKNSQSPTNIEGIFCFWLVFAKETKTLEFSGSQKREEKENGKNSSSLTQVAKLTLY